MKQLCHFWFRVGENHLSTEFVVHFHSFRRIRWKSMFFTNRIEKSIKNYGQFLTSTWCIEVSHLCDNSWTSFMGTLLDAIAWNYTNERYAIWNIVNNSICNSFANMANVTWWDSHLPRGLLAKNQAMFVWGQYKSITSLFTVHACMYIQIQPLMHSHIVTCYRRQAVVRLLTWLLAARNRVSEHRRDFLLLWLLFGSLEVIQNLPWWISRDRTKFKSFLVEIGTIVTTFHRRL